MANRYLAAVHSPLAPVQKPAPPARQAAADAALSISELAEGMLVRHPTFGPGVVTRVLERRRGTVQVLFDHHGEKTLVVEMARMQPQ